MHDAQENPAQSLAIGTVIDDINWLLYFSLEFLMILLLLCNLDTAPDKLLTELNYSCDSRECVFSTVYIKLAILQ